MDIGIKGIAGLFTALCLSLTGLTVFADENEPAVPELSDSSVQSVESTADEADSLPAGQESAEPKPAGAVVVSKTMTSAVVRITPVEGAVKYELINDGKRAVIKTLTPEEAYEEITLTGLIPQFCQPIRVRAYFEDGSSRITEKFNITTHGIKKATDLTVFDRSHSMTSKCSASLKWTRSPGVDGYIIYDSATDEELMRISGDTTTKARLSGLVTGSDLRVYVRSYVISDGKVYTGVTSNRTWIHCFPQNTALNVTSYNTNSISFTLDRSTGADGYYVYLSSDGRSFSKVLTLEGSDNTKGVIRGLSEKTPYYVKAAAYHRFSNNTCLSSCTGVKKVTTAEYRTVTAKGNIYPQAGYGEQILGTVPAGKKVLYFGQTGRWMKIRVGGVNGYIYNKAFGVTSNAALSQDMGVYVDDMLFESGTRPGDICTYVSENFYYIDKTGREKSRDQKAYEMLLLRCGSCYYYGALCDYMLERAGYQHRLIIGQSGFGEHSYNEYVTSAGTLYLDACPFIPYNGVVFYDWTWEQVKANRPGYTK